MARRAKRQAPGAAIFDSRQQQGFPLEPSHVDEPKKPPCKGAPPPGDARLQKHEALAKALDALYKAAGGADQGTARWRKLGHMPTNPIHARSRPDALSYLARLRLQDGQTVLCKRSRMLASKVSASPIECFEITRLDGGPLATLYVALDSAMNSEQPPEGFSLEPPGVV
jgi:hypothetical protein